LISCCKKGNSMIDLVNNVSSFAPIHNQINFLSSRSHKYRKLNKQTNTFKVQFEAYLKFTSRIYRVAYYYMFASNRIPNKTCST
jgi:hypothetical protein